MRMCTGFALLCLALAGPGFAAHRDVLVKSTSLTSTNPEAGEYVVSLALPGWLSDAELEYASLEIYFDASSWTETPTVYSIRVAVTDAVSTAPAKGPGTSAVRLAGGEADRVVLDVTDLVNYLATLPASGYLIVTVGDEGLRPALKSNKIAPSTIARLKSITASRNR